MRFKSVIAGALMMPAVAFAWPWSTDMMNQPNIKPQEGEMVPFPERSIPVQGLPTQVAGVDLEKAAEMAANYQNPRDLTRDLQNPIEPTVASVNKGRQLYKVYCGACHGNTGGAADEAPIASKIGAIPLVDSYVQETLTEGWLWGTITFGSYVMPSYGIPQGRRGSNDLNVEERWHVVNYIKHGLVKDHATATRTAAAE